MENIRNYIFNSKLAAEKVEDICRQTLKDKYGDNPPALIVYRLLRELEIISENHYAQKYLLAMGIAGKSRKLGYMHILRAAGGSSFAAYLMKISSTNPLPPHYYCPVCKHVEFVDESKCYTGYDLIKDGKACPVCGKTMMGDGHNIPYEIFLGLDGKKEPDFDFNVAAPVKPEIERYLQDVFGVNKVFYAGTENKMIHPGRIIICKPDVDIHELTEVEDRGGILMATVTDFHELDYNKYIDIDILEFSKIAVIKQLEEATGIIAEDINADDINLSEFFESPDSSCLAFINNNESLPHLISEIRPDSFAAGLKILGLLHGTDVRDANGEVLLKDGHSTADILAFRDDVMNYLLQHGIEREVAYSIMERTRKGALKRKTNKISDSEAAILKEHNISAWFMESINKISYLFPKAQDVEFGVMYLKLMYYSMNYPKEFQKVMDAISVEN